MKKMMRFIKVLWVFPLVAFLFTSCNDDNSYSLDKQWVSMVTVNALSNNQYDFTLDDGTKLWMAAPVGLNLNPKYKRAIINYTILSDNFNGYDHAMKLNSFYDVLTKGVLYVSPGDAVHQDSIGNNSIKIYSMWEGGGYLNIHFGFYAGGVNSHMLNLISASSDLGVSQNPVKLEFRHNQKGDPEVYSTNGYVSFDLSPYKIAGRDKVTFEITTKDYNGVTKTFTIDYAYGSAKPSQSAVSLSSDGVSSDVR